MRIIYVDDEKPAIENFRLTVANFAAIDELNTFQSGEEALDFVRENTVDAAFLDMEMPGIHGLGLAKELKKLDSEIRVVFVTAFGQYALEAFGVDAVGYILKPYTAADIRRELAKCTYRPLPSHRVVIETMPTLNISVDGVPLHVGGAKPREMLAFLVNSGERGFTVGECVACLWPDKPLDKNTQTLCRMTWMRLVQAFEDVGVYNVFYTAEGRRHIKTDAVSCDLYRFLDGEKQAVKKYNGEYLSEYEWAEDRNAQLYQMQHT